MDLLATLLLWVYTREFIQEMIFRDIRLRRPFIAPGGRPPICVSDIREVLEITEADGLVIFPSDIWPNHAAKAASEAKQTEAFDGNGVCTSRTIELQMQSKQGALNLRSQQPTQVPHPPSSRLASHPPRHAHGR